MKFIKIYYLFTTTSFYNSYNYHPPFMGIQPRSLFLNFHR